MPTPRPLVPGLLFATLGFAGCVGDQDPTTPELSAPSLSIAAEDASARQHLVTFRGKGIPASFDADVARLGGTVVLRHEALGLAMVAGLDGAEAKALHSISGVGQVEADSRVELESTPARPRALDEITIQSQTDPAAAILASWQWNLTAINADRAWEAGHLGSPDVTVAILDTGIDYDALDLDGLVDLARSASFVPSDDAITATYFPTRHPISDYHGHGTNVAQQVSSKAIALAGVTSHTTLIGVKVLGADGSGSIAGILFGMLHAADNGADVINLSLGAARLKAGGGGQLQGIVNSVLSYVNRADVLLVAAAGNDAIDLDRNLIPNPETGGYFHAPSLENDYCTSSHVICVSSVGPTVAGGSADIPSVFTNYGRSAVDVAGPGGNFGSKVSLWPWGPDRISWVWSLCSKTLLVFDEEGNIVGLPCASGLFVYAAVGTSQATPHVSGLAALLIAERGQGKPSQIKAAIRRSAVDLGQPGNDPFFGQGRIDVPRALGLD